MKRILKIVGITFIVVLIAAIASPFLFKDKLQDLLKKTINENLNATVSWESLEVSLLSNFPKATVALNDFLIVNNTPFKGDTLAQGKDLKIEMGIKQLFKKASQDPIKIDALQLDEAIVHLKINKEGKANYDIVKTSTVDSPAIAKDTNIAEPFVFDLAHYEINNSTIAYSDEASNTFFVINNLDHEGNGDFSAVESTLSTSTKGDISLDIEDTNYIRGQHIELDAAIELDLENQKYTFKENKGTINALPLTFDGFVQLVDDNTTMDITFETPDSNFKNFLAVIPQEYARNLDGVDTSGDFRVSGKIKGNVTENTIPTLDIAIVSNNASFKYPDLPKRMEGINIDARILNTTGIVDNSYILINALNFRIDDDVFSANGSVKNLTANMFVNLALKGRLNLANIEKVYPIGLEEPLLGIINADFSTNFDMASVENKNYQNIKSSGTASLQDFNYSSPELARPIAISNASVNFKPGIISLDRFNGTTGATDINATGTIENLIPFVMSQEDLKGRFKVTSNVFDMNDFMVSESGSTGQSDTDNEERNTGASSVKIPDFLNAGLDFTANKVIYDDLTLTEVAGSVTIQDESANLSDLTSSIFGGKAGLSGNVSTKNNTPVFNVALDLSKIDIDQSFSNLPLLKSLAPIAKALQGALSTKISLQGRLDENLSPILNTIEGNAIAQVETTDIQTSNMPLLAALDSKLDFINIADLNLETLTTGLDFKDGHVIVSPFDFKIKGVTVNVNGGHSFENVMDYTIDLDVPASYLGKDVSGLLSKLTAQERERLHVPLPIVLSGSFTNPTIKVNSQAAISNLSNQIIEIQKQHLKDKGNDILQDVLSEKVGGGAGTILKDVAGEILGGNSSTKDSIAVATPPTNTTSTTDEVIKDVATDILGGLLGSKKKKEVKKDSVY